MAQRRRLSAAEVRVAVPILRFADTAIGVAVGVAAGWVGIRVIRAVGRPPSGKPDDPAG